MSTNRDVLQLIGRIEGELVEIRKLNHRVAKLEIWQSWLRGGWVAFAAMHAYLFWVMYGR